MSVMNRKMFNRGARKELRKKGGIEDVQYFQQAGAVRGPGLGSTYFSRNYNPREAPVVGQIGANIPGAQKGQTFLAPYQVGTRGGFSAMQKATAFPITSVATLMAEGIFDGDMEQRRDHWIPYPKNLSYSHVPYEKFNERLSLLGLRV